VIDAAAAAAAAAASSVVSSKNASASTKKSQQRRGAVSVKMEAVPVPFDPQNYVLCPTDTFSGELMGSGHDVPLPAE
jgi:hypothetical protein